MTYLITWTLPRVHLTFSGKTTWPEIDQAARRISSDPRFKDCKLQLYDFSAADLSGISLAEAHHAARGDAAYSKINPGCVLAAVSADTTVEILTKYYKEMAAIHGVKWHIEHFDNIQAAENWFTHKFPGH